MFRTYQRPSKMTEYFGLLKSNNFLQIETSIVITAKSVASIVCFSWFGSLICHVEQKFSIGKHHAKLGAQPSRGFIELFLCDKHFLWSRKLVHEDMIMMSSCDHQVWLIITWKLLASQTKIWSCNQSNASDSNGEKFHFKNALIWDLFENRWFYEK